VLINWTDVLDGEIVNAAWAVAQMAAKPRTSRRAAADFDTASWADTERIIKDALAGVRYELPEMSDEQAVALQAAVERHEVQGALQALLAVRITDAPEADAAKAREALRLALGANAVSVSEYFDDKISGLVATLEGQVGFAGLAQVRSEAFSSRIVALLGAIERQVAALADPGSRAQAETQFIERYRRQVHQRHGFLTPPDFDRRRRVAIKDIYVPAAIAEIKVWEGPHSQDWESGQDFVEVWDLAGRLDRTVLLGDPGGGKTTAANVLTDYFATATERRIPFLITLRDYAAKTPIEWSLAEHIEHNLRTLYQSPAPAGLVERLLQTGRSIVVFDGLDELLDTSRRRDISDRVEQFCAAYPLTPVLVTSRVVGYDQARLDDDQFTCYRLGGFGDDEVAAYAAKWFAIQEGVPAVEAAAKAQAFVAESAHARDLRANPLLLSLMCILYRGAGSLPGDRAGIYAKCAELLLRKWDEHRDLYRKLEADHLVEPTLRHLAWWLITRQDGRTSATESELITTTAEFLYERGYESKDEARVAAREFVEFCRGRMWVFSDAGTNADGERLYGFTHRTFMEYFAAWHLAATADTPEDLARMLAPRISSQGWDVVGELAIKLKSDTSDRGADRVYAALLNPELLSADDVSLLKFLSARLPSARPSPSTVRSLTRAVLDAVLGHEPIYQGVEPLELLLNCGGNYTNAIGAELSAGIAGMVTSTDQSTRTNGWCLVLSVPRLTRANYSFWESWLAEQASRYESELAATAYDDSNVRALALIGQAVTVSDALAMPGGLTMLAAKTVTFRAVGGTRSWYDPYMCQLLKQLSSGVSDAHPISEVEAIGHHLLGQQRLPWVRLDPSHDRSDIAFAYSSVTDTPQSPVLDEIGNLGIAAAACIALELRQGRTGIQPGEDTTDVHPVAQYLSQRLKSTNDRLPELPVPTEFKQLFLDWAHNRVDFVISGGR